MTRSTLPTSLLFCAAALVAPIGCILETESASQIVPVTGTVNLDGVPVKKGVISFTPIHDQGIAAHGEIVDGAILQWTTRQRGDGVKIGRYHVTIVGIDSKTQELVDALQTPGSQGRGPDIDKLNTLWKVYKDPLPSRYANTQTSGLIVEVTPQGPNDFRFDLKNDEPSQGPGRDAGATSPEGPGDGEIPHD